MSEILADLPRILCVMLASGRQAMVDRAVNCFRAQRYPNKALAILDTGQSPIVVHGTMDSTLVVTRMPLAQPKPIGELRNIANALSVGGALDCDVIAHWDSDDWSHPLRLTEQLAFLQASGAQAVGYSEMLFWDSAAGQFCGAWMYRSPNPLTCLGTSLCYWRDTWLKRPFPDAGDGEEVLWLLKVKAKACSSANIEDRYPRMIAAIHGGNTTSRIQPGVREWTRRPDWDRFCRETMKL